MLYNAVKCLHKVVAQILKQLNLNTKPCFMVYFYLFIKSFLLLSNVLSHVLLGQDIFSI